MEQGDRSNVQKKKFRGSCWMLSWQRTICPVPQVTSGSNGSRVLRHFSVTNPDHVCRALRIGAMPGSPTALLLAGFCQRITLLQLSAELLWCVLITLFREHWKRQQQCVHWGGDSTQITSIWGTNTTKIQQAYQATSVKSQDFSHRHWESKSTSLSSAAAFISSKEYMPSCKTRVQSQCAVF